MIKLTKEEMFEIKKDGIVVLYDGSYPNTCGGTLKIVVDGKQIYGKRYCCHSTGNVWFDDDWGSHVDVGELVWNDAEDYSKEVQEAVQLKLENYRVCCGGCI